MGDPCTIVKLSEVFSVCYAEQYDAYRNISKFDLFDIVMTAQIFLISSMTAKDSSR